jgi:hypothetical protein
VTWGAGGVGGEPRSRSSATLRQGTSGPGSLGLGPGTTPKIGSTSLAGPTIRCQGQMVQVHPEGGLKARSSRAVASNRIARHPVYACTPPGSRPAQTRDPRSGQRNLFQLEAGGGLAKTHQGRQAQAQIEGGAGEARQAGRVRQEKAPVSGVLLRRWS